MGRHTLTAWPVLFSDPDQVLVVREGEPQSGKTDVACFQSNPLPFCDSRFSPTIPNRDICCNWPCLRWKHAAHVVIKPSKEETQEAEGKE
jgi:hypothetical protein